MSETPSKTRKKVKEKRLESFTEESRAKSKKKTSKIKSTILKKSTQNTKLSPTLTQDLTLKEEVSRNFWKNVPQELLKELWLPIKTDSLDMELNSSFGFSENSKLNSLFNVTSYQCQKMMSYPKISSVLSQFLQQDTMEKDQQKIEEGEKKLKLKKEEKRKRLLKKKEKNQEKINELEEEIKKLNDQKKIEKKRKLIKKLNIYEDIENTKLKTPPNSCIKIPFHPDNELKQKLNRCFGCGRRAYNNGVAYINKKIKEVVEKKKRIKEKIEENPEYVDYENLKVTINQKDLREVCITNDKIEQEINEKDRVIYDIKDIELQRAYDSFKNKNRKKLYLHFRCKKYMYRESFTIPYKHLKGKDTFCLRLVNEIANCMKNKDKIDISNINYACIVSKTKTGKYSLSIPIFKPSTFLVEKQDQDKEVKIVSIDPGTRTPFTCYDPSGKCFKIGDEKIDNLYLFYLERDAINSRIDELKKIKGKFKTRIQIYKKICRRIRRLNIAGHKIQEKLTNKRNQFHYDSIKYLLSNYDSVLIPKFQTSQMMKKEERKLNETQVRKLGLWRHSQFRIRLIEKAELIGKKVIVTDEQYTTKTCGNCGKINNITIEKEFNCEGCHVKLDRDINASRNILIRFLSNLPLNYHGR